MSRLADSMVDARSLERAFRNFPNRFRTHEVFRDFCEAASASMANAGAPQDDAWRKREDAYLRIAARYGEDFQRFPEILGLLVQAMENASDQHGATTDVLGLVFERLELSNHFAGQYFTPMSLCEMMASITTTDLVEKLERQEVITALEPASGSGRTVLALANAIRRLGYPPTKLDVVTVDVDPLCCWMCHINLSLAAVPATVVNGNSLSCEEWWRVTTPMLRLRPRVASPLSRIVAQLRELEEQAIVVPVPAEVDQAREPELPAPPPATVLRIGEQLRLF